MKTVKITRLDASGDAGYTQALGLEDAIARFVIGLVLKGEQTISVAPVEGDPRAVKIDVHRNRGVWEIAEIDS